MIEARKEEAWWVHWLKRTKLIIYGVESTHEAEFWIKQRDVDVVLEKKTSELKKEHKKIIKNFSFAKATTEHCVLIKY